MADIYIKSKNETAIRDLCARFKHVIGPVRGVSATTDENGDPVPAKGDPNYWYACAKDISDNDLKDDIDICDYDTGYKVCGVWA